MRVQIIDNRSQHMSAVLDGLIRHSADIRMAVAFVSRAGLSLLDPALEAALQSQAKVEFLVGLDKHWTEPSALRYLYNFSQRTQDVHLYCYASLKSRELYHPKLYLLGRENSASAVIGSSNLTVGGLRSNVEVNTVITGTPDDEVISDAYGAYSLLKFLPGRFTPDEELIKLYEELALQERSEQRATRSNETTRRLAKQFKEKAQSLRPPTATTTDLTGWLKLVYDVLPTVPVTNKEIYGFEGQFRAKYPGNKNIRAKVRQQLQTLARMRLIEHLGEGRWRKL